MDEGQVPGLWAPQRRALTAGLVLTITFVASEALAVVTVMPVVARDLGGLSLYGWVFSGFMLGSVVGIVAAGREADRRGPAVPFVAGVVLFGCRAGRRGPGSLDGGAGGGPGDAGSRRRRGALGGQCHHRPEPARGAATPDDGRPVDRVGRARPGLPGDQRRG